MGHASVKLRRVVDGFSHWCPGCEEVHFIRTSNGPPCWAFNQNVDRPSFAPSVKITGVQTVVENGRWTGEWKRGPDGKALPCCCHYFLTDGVLIFQNDCTHQLKGQRVQLPDLPDFLTDDLFEH